MMPYWATLCGFPTPRAIGARLSKQHQKDLEWTRAKSTYHYRHPRDQRRVHVLVFLEREVRQVESPIFGHPHPQTRSRLRLLVRDLVAIRQQRKFPLRARRLRPKRRSHNDSSSPHAQAFLHRSPNLFCRPPSLLRSHRRSLAHVDVFIGCRRRRIPRDCQRRRRWSEQWSRWRRWHWGQRGSYPVGKLRVSFEFLSNLLATYPVGKLWIHLKFAHHFDHNLPGG